MRYKVINSSEMDTVCMSALRYTDSCEQCDKVTTCKLDASLKGKYTIACTKSTKATAMAVAALRKARQCADKLERSRSEKENT